MATYTYVFQMSLPILLIFLAVTFLACVLFTKIERFIQHQVTDRCLEMEKRLIQLVVTQNSLCLDELLRVAHLKKREESIRLKETTCNILEEAHNLLQSGSSLPQDLLTQVNKIKKDATKYRPHTRRYLESRFPLLFPPNCSSQPLTPGNS